MFKGGKILVENRKDNGLLCGPGGHIEMGEIPEEAAIRETREEFGINVAELIPVAIISDMPEEYCPSQVFLCTEFFGTPVAFNTEMENARFEPVSDVLKHKMFLSFQLSVQELIKQLKHFHGDEIVKESGLLLRMGSMFRLERMENYLRGIRQRLAAGRKLEKKPGEEKLVDYKATEEYSKAIKGVVTVKRTSNERSNSSCCL